MSAPEVASPAVVARLRALEARCAAVVARGGAAHDAATLAYVKALLARSATLPPAVANVMAAKIDARLSDLEVRLVRARDAAKRAVLELAERGATEPDVQRWYEAGRFGDVAVHAPRLLREQTKPRRERAPLEAPRSFERAAAQARALVAVARAADDLPETVGPYNGLVVAVRTLRALAQSSPALLAAHVSRLSDLSALLGLEGPKKPSAKKSAAGGRKPTPRSANGKKK